MPLKDPIKRAAYKAAWFQANKERLKPSMKESHKRYQARHPEYKKNKDKRHYLKHKDQIRRQQNQYWVRYGRVRFHGVEPEEFQAMFLRQGGKCAICPRTLELQGRGTHIDHDHVTGKVRDLLCSKCNPGLGLFDEDPARLRAAADYIERHKS
jgi:hypothetical protein